MFRSARFEIWRSLVQLVSLPPAKILNSLCSIWNICLFIYSFLIKHIKWMLNTFDTYVYIKKKNQKMEKKITYVWEQPTTKKNIRNSMFLLWKQKIDRSWNLSLIFTMRWYLKPVTLLSPTVSKYIAIRRKVRFLKILSIIIYLLLFIP